MNSKATEEIIAFRDRFMASPNYPKFIAALLLDDKRAADSLELLFTIVVMKTTATLMKDPEGELMGLLEKQIKEYLGD